VTTPATDCSDRQAMALMLGASSTTRAPIVRMSAEAPRAALWKPGEVAPQHLTGVLAGDAGFDPLLFTALANKPVQDLLTGGFPNMNQRKIILANQTPEQQLASVEWMRDAEIKHARLAMLAVAGWPLSELVNGPLLQALGTNGRAPSLLNGALLDGPFVGVVSLALAAVAFLELNTAYYGAQGGDYGFDPLGCLEGTGPLPKMGEPRELRSAELHNGRLAMLAITGFVAQECVWGLPVVEQTPWFFGR